MPKNAATPEAQLNAHTDSKNDVTKKRKPSAEAAKGCLHSVFWYTPKRSRQVCATCGAGRRISFNKDNTATVGPWKEGKARTS